VKFILLTLEVYYLKIIKQIFWIFAFSFFGEVISSFLPIAIPGSVIGMILIFTALHFHWIEMDQVDEVGTWLTDNMAVFFVPAGVALMTNFNILSQYWWQLIIVILVSLSLMLWFVGLVVQTVKRKIDKRNGNSIEGGR